MKIKFIESARISQFSTINPRPVSHTIELSIANVLLAQYGIRSNTEKKNRSSQRELISDPADFNGFKKRENVWAVAYDQEVYYLFLKIQITFLRHVCFWDIY